MSDLVVAIIVAVFICWKLQDLIKTIREDKED